MYDFSNRKKKMIKNIWIKVEVEGEIERRGDNIYKVSNEISKEERKNFVFGITFLTFFQKY